MMKTNLLKAAMAIAILFTAAGCEKDTFTDDINTPVEPAEQMTFEVSMPDDDNIETRVAYDDDKVVNGSTGSLTWESGDMLMVVGYDEAGNYKGQANDYVYQGQAGGKSGKFRGTKIAGATKFDLYYPNTVKVDTKGNATFELTTQTQAADGSTAHLKQNLFLAAKKVYKDENPQLALQNTIIKFLLTNISADIEALSAIAWSIETADGTYSQTLNFADNAIVFSSGKSDLTAYMAIPAGKAIKAGGKFSVQVQGTKAYSKQLTSTGGKQYESGKRYTATMKDWTIVKESMQLTATVPSEGSTLNFYLPFPTSGVTPADMTINWGDNNTTYIPAGTSLSSTDLNHTYTAANTYQITISTTQYNSAKQQIPAINFYSNKNTDENNRKIISMDTPILNTGQTSFEKSFYQCRKLAKLSEGLFDKNAQATDFNNCFYNCEGLTEIPGTMFRANTEATTFESCFFKCYGLESIPSGLFDTNTKATTFDSTFRQCKAITGIPTGLFDKNTKVVTYERCFNECYLLKTIPTGLFDYNPDVTNFWSTFNTCKALQAIPSNLFDNNTKVQTFQACFQYCETITAIPTGLFDKNTLATTFQGTFGYCKKLKSEGIPATLFTKNTKATTFSGVFSSCYAMEYIPSGLFDKNTLVTTFDTAFSDCTSLKSSGIPAAIFAKNTKVTNFSSCFKGCNGTAFTTVPAELFSANTLVDNFNSCFNSCSNLTSVPGTLFAQNKLAKDFSSCFTNSGLKSIPSNLFSANTAVTTFQYCFSSCKSLGTIPAGLFNTNQAATNFYGCFNACTNTTMNNAIFCNPVNLNRFSGKTMNFTNCFNSVGKDLPSTTASVAPELWNYTGNATWTTSNCFYFAQFSNKYSTSLNTKWGTPK